MQEFPGIRQFTFQARVLLTLVAVAAGFTAQGSAQQAATQSVSIPARITQAVDNSRMVAIPHSVPSFAQAQYDKGAVADDTPVAHTLLLLKRSSTQEAALTSLMARQQRAASGQYHKWLTPQQFAGQFGLAQSDLQQITQWLQGNGFTVNKISRGGVAVDFSGTAGQIRNAFHTELHTYKKDGAVYHANAGNPEIPLALAPVVSGFVSLNDFKPVSDLHVMGTAQYNPKTHMAKPSWNASNPCYDSMGNLASCTYFIPTPQDLAVQYSLTSVYKAGTTGAGETIGIVGDSNIDLGVVQNYRTVFGLDPKNLPQVIVDGGDPAQNADAEEGYLDVEAAGAMAPAATINYYVSDGSLTTSGITNAILRAVDDDAADVLSVSYGVCEENLGPQGNQFFSAIWEQASAQGESVFVAAGDGGSAGCDPFSYASAAQDGLAVSGFASTPYDTAVGGTDFYYPAYAAGTGDTKLQAELAQAWSGFTTTLNPTATLAAPIQEQPWNTSLGLNIEGNAGYGIVGGSGGASSCTVGTDVDPITLAYGSCTAGYAKPSWQTGPGVPADSVRDLPDISLFAANGSNLSFWPICASVYDCEAVTTTPGYSLALTGVGGTSAATPATAGIMALLDQSQKGRQGNMNYKLYALASQHPAAFNDVTVGSNNVPCNQGSPNCSLDTNGDGFYTLQHYAAGPGYDQASGLGTLNAANLFAEWSNVTIAATASQTSLTVSPASFAHGSAVTLTSSVNGSGGTPTGSVAVTTNIPGQLGQGTIELAQGTGSASVQGLPGGTYTMQGVYSGDGAFAASTSTPVSVTVTAEPSVVTLTGGYVNSNYQLVPLTSGLTLGYGRTYYLDAAITGKSGYGLATGSVVFMDGATALGTANISQGGVAELVTGALLPGQHTITANYAGDPSFTASNSTSSLALTVTKGTPFVNYNGPAGGRFGVPVYVNQPLLITVTVDGGSYSLPPTGTVAVQVGTLAAQQATLTPSYPGSSSGIATVVVTPTTAGTFPLSLSYSGDGYYLAASPSYPESITVQGSTLAATTTTLTTSTTTVGPDGTVLVSFRVSGANPTVIPSGTVALILGGSPFAPLVTLDATGSGSLLISGSSFPTGPSMVNAVYRGDTNYAGSTSNAILLNSNQGDFSLTTPTPNLIIAAGSSATATLSLASVPSQYVLAGLSGTASLTCTTSDPSVICTLAKNSVTLTADGIPQTVQATINTNTPAATQAAKTGSGAWTQRITGGIALAAVLLWIPRRRTRAVRLLMGLLLGCVLAGTAGLVGCGGGGGSKPPTPTPTPTPNPGTNAAAGTYQVSVLANAGGVQHTLLMHVSVR